MTPAFATTLSDKLDLADLVAQADDIVAGTVASVEVRSIDGSIFTFYTLSVGEALKGDAGQSVVVAIPGGTYERNGVMLAETVPGAAALIGDVEQLLFIEDNEGLGAATVVGFSQGTFTVSGEGAEKSFTAPGGVKMKLKDLRTLAAAQ